MTDNNAPVYSNQEALEFKNQTITDATFTNCTIISAQGVTFVDCKFDRTMVIRAVSCTFSGCTWHDGAHVQRSINCRWEGDKPYVSREVTETQGGMYNEGGTINNNGGVSFYGGVVGNISYTDHGKKQQ